MNEQLIKSESQFSFRFEGKNEIDAILLSKTINDMVQLTKLAAIDECQDAYFKMKIMSFRDGSFKIDFSTISEVAENLYRHASDAATLAGTLFTVVKGYFEVKNHLKGKKPKSVVDKPDSKIEIENADSEKIEVPKSSFAITNNVKIDNLTVQIAGYVKTHNPNGGFSFETHDSIQNFSSEDVDCMLQPVATQESSSYEKYVIKTDLPIRKADLLKNSAWEFIFQGKTIKANIQDKKFIENVHSGLISLKAKDYINATLEIRMPLDGQGAAENSPKYTVLEVNGDVMRGCNDEQLSLL